MLLNAIRVFNGSSMGVQESRRLFHELSLKKKRSQSCFKGFFSGWLRAVENVRKTMETKRSKNVLKMFEKR